MKFTMTDPVGRATAASILALITGASSSLAATRPCDIYKDGGTPCVAAHSSVRALFGDYAGNLYQVKRGKDSAVKEIGVLEPGGFADSKTQDDFCAGTTCTISILYDQSGKGNHLTAAPAGGAVKSPDKRVVATDEKLVVDGHTVYGMKFKGGMGYRNNKTNGIAVGDQPESMYMVTNGTFFNSLCCFDYGNAETTNNDDGAGTMEAIYFGNQSTYWGWGNTSILTNGKKGPWVEADMENGLFAGNVFGQYSGNTPVPYTYVTAMLKGKSNWFTIKGGDANAGTLKSMYDGARPSFSDGKYKWNPMRLQGAIILGIGGDNSNGSQGIFYEGCMTSGYASTATDDAIQKNIIAAGYGSKSGTMVCQGDKAHASDVLILPPDASGTLQIVDSRGRFRQAPVRDGQVDFGHLPKGIYLARLMGDASREYQKLVVLP